MCDTTLRMPTVPALQGLRGRVPNEGQLDVKYFPWGSIADETAMLNALKASLGHAGCHLSAAKGPAKPAA